MEEESSLPSGAAASYGGTNVPGSPTTSPSTSKPPVRSEYSKIRNNVSILAGALFLLLTSFHGVAILQSTLNRAAGSHSLAAIFASMIVSSLLLTNWIMSVLSVKWAIVMGMGCYTLYVMGQFYPTPAGLIISGLIMGFGASAMWAGFLTYVSQVSRRVSALTGVDCNTVTGRVMAYTHALIQFSYTSGSLISSTVLSSTHITINSSSPLPPAPEDLSPYCGLHYCPSSNSSSLHSLPTLLPPSPSDVQLLVGIFVGIALLAVSMVALMLDPLATFDERGQGMSSERPSPLAAIRATLRVLLTPNMALMMTLAIWAGFSHGFLVADYDAAFVGCAIGIHMIGYTVMLFGAGNAIGSLLLALVLVQRGRALVYIVGGVLSSIGLFLMYLWSTVTPDTALLFLIPMIWGLADSIWQTQTKALFVSVFPSEPEEVFTVAVILEAFGFLLNYLLQPVMCNSSKVSLLIVILTVALITYSALEFQLKRSSARREDVTPIVEDDLDSIGMEPVR